MTSISQNVTPAPKGRKATPRQKAKRREKASTHKAVATRLHSLIIRQPGVCERAGMAPGDCEGPIQCAHIIRRARSMTRTDLANGMICCARHHAYLDQHILELIEHVDATRGAGTYRALQAKADSYSEHPTGALVFWRAERRRLEEIARERGIIR